MAKEWILNQANMRGGLTRKTKVGAVADLIRKCAPKELAEWEGYYYKNGCTKDVVEEIRREIERLRK
jgi:predicted DNA-binding transcriptional regulator